MDTWRSCTGRSGFRLTLFCVVLALVICLVPGSGQSAENWSTAAEVDMQVVGQLGGAVNAVAVTTQYAYAGVGPRLVVLSLSNRANPQWVGQTGLFAENVRAVAVSPSLSYVYAAAGAAGLRIIRVDSPAAPVEVGVYAVTGNAVALALDGAYLYMLVEEAGAIRMEVVNVSDAQNPTRAGHYIPVPVVMISDAHVDLDVDAGYAYLALDAAGLQVVDVRNPRSPVLVGRVAMAGLARDVDVDTLYAYVAAESSWDPGLADYVGGGLSVVDIADKANPTEVGFCPIQDQYLNDVPEGIATGVQIQKPYAYVAAQYGGMWVVNVARTDMPEKVKQYTTQSVNAKGLAILDTYVYLVDPDNGLRVLDVGQPDNPTPVGVYPTISQVENLDLAGNYAYLADGRNGLRVVDVTHLANPMLRATLKASAWDSIGDVKVSGRYAYATDPLLKVLHVIDVNSPSSPAAVAAVSLPAIANSVAVQPNLALVASGGLSLLDIRSPSAAKSITTCVTGGQPLAVAVAGEHAYVAAAWGGLQVVRIANPQQPERVGGTTVAWDARNVAIASNKAYVVDGYFGLRIMDISDPRAPRQVKQYQYEKDGVVETAQQVALGGNYAYVAASGGVHAMNVSDSSYPYEAGFLHLPWPATDLVVAADHAYVAAGRAGLYILRIQITPPTPTPTRTRTATPTITLTVTRTSVPTNTPVATATRTRTATPATRRIYLPVVRRH